MNNSREQFEIEMLKKAGFSKEMFAYYGGRYFNPEVIAAWKGWQACEEKQTKLLKQALLDIKNGKDNPCFIVNKALNLEG